MVETKTGKLKMLFLAVLAVIFVIVYAPGQTQANTGINQQISFEGKIVTSSGANVPDGVYNLQFKIYQDGGGCVSGGTSPCGGTLKWTESRLVSNSQGVTVTAGTFQVNLGSVTALTGIDWNQDTLWLSMNVGGTANTATPTYDGEMTPFIRLTAVPYALNAGTVGGLSASQLVQLQTGTITNQTGGLGVTGNIQAGGTVSALTVTQNGNNVCDASSNCTNYLTNSTGVQLQSGTPGTAQTGNFNITGTGIAGALQVASGGTIDSTSLGALNIGTTASTSTVNIGRATQNVVLPGTVYVNGSTTGFSRIVVQGTQTSTTTTAQYGIQNQMNFAPSGASLTNLYALLNIPVLTASSAPITSVLGNLSRIDTASGYSGQITNAIAFDAGTPSLAGTNPITNYYGVRVENNNTNIGVSGNTVTNYGISTYTPSANSSYTTNYGLYIQGNGGASATNYSLYNASTALSYFAGSAQIVGNLAVGTITAGTWNGSTIAAAYGGTGQSSYTVGDLLYASSSNALSKLSAGAAGYCLLSNGAGTAPTWGSCGSGGTLQTDYTAGTGGSTPDIAEDATRLGLDIQGYSGQSADLLDLRSYASGSLGAIQFGVSPSGTVTAATGYVGNSLDRATSGTLSIGATNASTITIGNGNNGTSVNINAGILNLNSAGLSIGGTFTGNTAINSYSTIQSNASTQYGTSSANTFTPQVANANIYALNNLPLVSGSQNVGVLIGTNSQVGVISYTGVLADARALNIGINGTNSTPFTSYTGAYVNSIANGGNTSGTVTNTQVLIQGNTSSAGTGGTVNNYGLNLTQPSGSGGTTNNYGLYITGNGGGTTNYSLYNNSTAASYFAGNLQVVGAITGGTYNGTTLTGTSLAFTGAATINAVNNALTVSSGTGLLTLGSTSGTVNIVGPTYTTTTKGVQIGTSTASATPTLLLLNQGTVASGSETGGSCATGVNGGALYYNTNSNAIRACVNSGWEDLISTAGLGLLIFGIVPDSGTDPGDIISTGGTAHVTGPCKVSWATSSSVKVDPCIAYSGGHKVVVPATTLSTTNATANNYQHVCLTGTNNAPALTTAAAENSGFPTWSIGNPVLCIADIYFSAANNTISGVFDVRTFTTSTKEFFNTSSAMGLGWMGCLSTYITTCGTTTAGADTISGVVAASNGATSTTTPNAILVTAGLAAVKSLPTGNIAGDVVINSTTANRAQATATTAGSALYSSMGLAQNTGPTIACTAGASIANCDDSTVFDMNRR